MERPAWSRTAACIAVAMGGFAALGWETVWQLRVALAIGISSQATAIVVATTMGGMAIGTVGAGMALQRVRKVPPPLLLYGLAEVVVGLWGLLLPSLFGVVSGFDTALFRAGQATTTLPHVAMMALVLGPPTIAMGATVPLLGLAGRQLRVSLALLYGVNTLGAAIGTLIMGFVVLPALGVWKASLALVVANLAAAVLLAALSRQPLPAPQKERPSGAGVDGSAFLVVFVTGFSVFLVEVVFFRAMRAAFVGTTHTFAVMLASVLLALAVGAKAARLLRPAPTTIPNVLGLGGIAILVVQPLVERMDYLARFFLFDENLSNLFLSLAVIGPPVAVIGVLFPYVLDRAGSPREWGLLHGCNTVGAIVGALSAAWVLLPTIGIARSITLAGVVPLVAAVALGAGQAQRLQLAGLGAAAVVLALLGGSGLGTSRVVIQRGWFADTGSKIIDYDEAVDYSVTVLTVEGYPELWIDGVGASSTIKGGEGYMAWMGRLPMLAHPDPKDALIICFGRGETANALRDEGPQWLDIVDVSKSVLAMAHHFPNRDVLHDPRVHPHVMDGRAWLRRTDKMYDAITLEPMPPTLAGVNALYSREFYELADARLRPGGVVAQWVPFHLITPDQSRAIVRTFIDVFPDAFLWNHDPQRTGILVGRKPPAETERWPGLVRRPGPRGGMSEQAVADAVILEGEALVRYAAPAPVITDDNQHLAYGIDTLTKKLVTNMNTAEQFQLIDETYADIASAREAKP